MRYGITPLAAILAAAAPLALAQTINGAQDAVLRASTLSGYGIDDIARQRTTARAMLLNVGQDRTYARSGAIAATAYAGLTLFAGGSGVSVDVVTVKPEVRARNN